MKFIIAFLCLVPTMLISQTYFLEGSFIYWTPHAGGTEYVMSGFNPTSQGHLKNFDGKYFPPALKLKGELTAKKNSGTFLVGYTRFTQNTEKQITSSTLYPTFDIAALSTPSDSSISRAKGKWGIDFNTLDIELAQETQVSKALFLRPFVGLKEVWQQQNLGITYDVDLIPQGNERLTMHSRQKQLGAGIRTGLDSRWELKHGFNLIGNFALSGLYINYKLHRKDKENEGNLPPIIHVNTDQHMHLAKSVFEWDLGMLWQKNFRSDGLILRLSIRWEEQVWINNNYFITITKPAEGKNLSFQGLRVACRLDF